MFVSPSPVSAATGSDGGGPPERSETAPGGAGKNRKALRKIRPEDGVPKNVGPDGKCERKEDDVLT